MRYVYTGVWMGEVFDKLAEPRKGDYIIIGTVIEGEFQEDVVDYRLRGVNAYAVYEKGQIKWPTGQRSTVHLEGDQMTLVLGDVSTIWALDIPKEVRKLCPTCNGVGTVPVGEKS